VLRILRIAESGKLRRVHPNAGFREYTLRDETKAVTVPMMDLVIRMVLAGPAEDFQDWYGKPIAKYVDRTFGDLLNNINKRESRLSKKTHSLDHDPATPKKKRSESEDSESNAEPLNAKEIRNLEKQLVSYQNELESVISDLSELTKSIESNQQRIQQLTFAIQQREN